MKQNRYNNSSISSLPLAFANGRKAEVRRVFILFIIMLMGVGSAWADTWDGTNPTTTWDAANRTTAGITGSGTEADPYVIHDAKGFVYFWWAANNGNLSSSTQYWKLDADIDLANKSWPYANLNKAFKGKFDGQNHTISNIKLEPATANYNYGLFCVIQGADPTNHAVVKNLTISNTTIAPSADFGKTTSIGILAGKADGNVDITNVTISGTSSITYAKKINDENYIGGLLGQITGANTTVTNCHVSSLTMTAKNTTTNAYFAGLIGRINAQGTVTNCNTTDVTINYELIANASRLGGLVSNSRGTNTGTPTVITGCTATRTKINLPKGINNACYIGAFIGQVNNQQQVLTNNTVDSPEITIGTDIIAASYIGGAIGDFSGSSAVYMGSLTGLTVTSPSVTVDKVSIKDNYIGAVFGRIYTYSTINDVDVSDPTLTYKNTSAPNFALNLGSFAGGIFGTAAQETAVTKIDVTGDATVTIGSNNNVQNVKAGLIGQSTTNVRLEGWTIENTTVDVQGSLATAASQLGGFAGYLASGNGAPLNMTNVKITGNSTVSVSGNISVASQIAGFAGQIANANNADAKVNIDDAGITGTSTITVGGNVASGSHFGGFTGNLLGRAQLNALVDVKNISLGTSNITITGQVTTGSYYGGLVGLVSQGCKLTNWGITTASNLTFNNNINAASYIGGAIGDLTGGNGYTSSVKTLTVTAPSISVKNYSAGTSLTGGVFGRVSTFTEVDGVDLTNASLTFTNDLSVAQQIGTFAGTITGNGTQQITVKKVTIDKSNLTFGSSNTSNTVGLKAGLIGQLATNVLLDTWTISGNSSITINGNIKTTASQIGNFVGNVTGDTNGPVTIKNVTFSGNVTTNITGAMSVKDCKIGGAIGQMASAGKVNNPMEVNNFIIEGTTNVTIGGECTTAVYVGGFAAHYASNASQDNSAKLTDITLSTTNININGDVKAASYFGGLIGYTTTGCDFNNLTIDTPTLTFDKNIGAASYIGGAIGDFIGASGYTSSIKTLTVTAPSISVKNYSAGTSLTGGVFGRVSTFTEVDGVDLTNASLTFTNDLSVAQQIGTFAGTITGNATQQISVKNVTIDKSDLTFGSSATSNTVALNAGIIGKLSSNVLLDTWDVTGISSITINGNLATTANYLGGFAGNVAGADYTVIEMKNITMSGSDINVTGNIGVANYLGGFAGYMLGTAKGGVIAATKVSLGTSGITISGKVTTGSYFGGLVGQVSTNCTVDDMKIATNANLTFNADITASSYVGGAFGNILGAAGGLSEATAVKTTDVTILFKGNTPVAMYVGGLSGQVTTLTNVYNWSAESPTITFTNPITVASYVGGGIGNFTGGALATPSVLDGISVNKPSLTINNITIKDACVGGVFGRINNYSSVANASVSNSNLTYNGDINVNIHIGDVAGYITGAAAQETIIDSPSSTNGTININGNVTANSLNLGGIAGYFTTVATITETNVKSTKFNFNGNVTGGSLYIGGVVGYQKAATIQGATVDGADIALNGNNASNMYVGGSVGWMNPEASPITTLEQVVVKNSKIHAVGSHTYAKGNKALVVGGVAGYVGHSNATTFAEVNKCVTENIDINLSGFIPEAANTSGSLYNQQQNAFVIGGVIGRINTPYSLPEHLYFSGKIYAPFAAVGPVVGVFYNNVGAATYLYDDYSGENASKLPAGEWDKADTWYFSNYQLGLSPEVLNQTDRTKNFTASTTNIGGVEYLTIDESTLTDFNSIGGVEKHSKTILMYDTNNKNQDKGIYPQWTTNSITYPAYYMYYMQGVNRATFNDEIDIEKVLIGFAFAPQLTRSGNDDSGYVFTVDLNGFDPGTEYTITYQWYESDKTTPIAGGTSSSLSISKDELDAAGGTVYCVVTASADGMSPFSVTLQGSNVIVVFVDASKGANNVPGSRKRGWTPATAVKTLDHANTLLVSSEDGGTWDNNFIVIIGTLNNGACFMSRGSNPATLTGKWGDDDYKGIISLGNNNDDGLNEGEDPTKVGSHNYVLADTKFENLTFKSTGNGQGAGTQVNFHCHGKDVWFGKGLVLSNFGKSPTNHTNIYDEEVPNFSIILTATNLSYPGEEYWTRTKPQVLTIESGHYARILGGRFTNPFFSNPLNEAHAIQATPKHPSWAIINIDIDPDNQMTSAEGKVYSCDVNLVCAGLTDGTIYEDLEINIHGGIVNTVVGGNQGNAVRNGVATLLPAGGKSGAYGQWPNSSFFGRTIINVEEKDGLKPITIRNMYGGGLGRNISSNKDIIVDMYEYGRTEINMKSGKVLGNIYGGGVGGVLGANPWDPRAPYATTAADNATNAIQDGVRYGGMPAGSEWAKVTLHNHDGHGGYTTEEMDLSQSSTTINISGGTIGGGLPNSTTQEGNIYGGGDGEVPEMPESVTLQGVGSVFGTSNIIITGGEILGSVYGGSKGSTVYYKKTNSYGQTINHIAEMNGTVNLKIIGTEEKYPTIAGDIYGGGLGISSGYNETTEKEEEYLRIATAGNAELDNENPDKYKTNINILIDLPESHPFNGNIYGGGQMGAVDGTTTVVIKGGTFNGDVFGGGKGEEGHPDKAKVTGETNVIVDSNWTEPTPPTP